MDNKIVILEDETLENVAGGEFGETEHTTPVNDQNYH